MDLFDAKMRPQVRVGVGVGDGMGGGGGFVALSAGTWSVGGVQFSGPRTPVALSSTPAIEAKSLYRTSEHSELGWNRFS